MGYEVSKLRGFVTALYAPDGVRPDLALLWGVVGARSGLLLLFGACLSWSASDSGKQPKVAGRCEENICFNRWPGGGKTASDSGKQPLGCWEVA